MKTFVVPFILSCFFCPNLFASDHELEEVVVTSSGVETPYKTLATALTVIDKEEIELRGYTSLSEILRNQVGVSASNAGGLGNQTSLRIRGEEGFRTLVIIDGVSVSDPTGTQAMPQVQHLTNTIDIERIEILRGPQGFVFGADAGGVINILTRSSDEGFDGELSAEYGRYGFTGKGFASTGNESADAFISLTHTDFDGFNARVIDTSGEDDGYDNTTLHAKFGLKGEHARAQLVLRNTDATNAFDNCFALVGDQFIGVNDCIGDFNQMISRLNLTLDYDTSEHQIGISRTTVDRENFALSTPSFSTDGVSQTFDYIAKLNLNDYWDVVVGADLTHDRVEASSGELLSRQQKAGFTELRGNIASKLFVGAGLRFDEANDFGEHVSSRLSAAYIQPVNEQSYLKFRGSHGTGFRAPSLAEIAYNAGPFAFGEAAETILKEEVSEGLDVGIDYVNDKGTTLALTFFDQRIENEIIFDLIGFSGYLQEGGKTDSTGVEFNIDTPLSRRILLNMGATYNDTERADGGQRLRRPKIFGQLGFTLKPIEPLTVLINGRFSHDAIDIGGIELEDYEVVDVSVNYSINKKARLFARIENIVDEHYEEITGFNTAGRAGHLGASFQF